MAISILFSSFLSTLFIFYALTKEFRTAWLKTTIVYGVLICLLTESLSLVKSVTFSAIVSFWLGALIVNLGLIVYLHRQNSLPTKALYCQIYQQLRECGKYPLGIVIGLALFFTLLTALIAAPNNWDSMTYHMPRVMHWIQNQSVEHYPTNNLRQISFPPASSYLVMQLQILAGGDQFANLVQWLAYLGCILVSSLISEIVIAKEHALTGALIIASIPMAIMQATTTQNDLVVSYWLLCSLYFILRNTIYNFADICWLGICFSLAIFTKPTAYIFGFPIGCLWLVRFLTNKQRSWKLKVLNLFVLIIIFVFISIPYWFRNYQLFGSAIGIDTGTRSEILSISTILSNLTRLLAINLPIPNIWSVIKWLHTSILQIDINDPRTTLVDITKYQTARSVLQFIAPHEDFVGSPIHLILFSIGFYLSVRGFLSKNKSNLILQQVILLLSISSLIALLLFCLLLKFQPWHNRLLLPFFILGTPTITYTLFSCSNKLLVKGVITVLSFTMIAYCLTPIRRPLVPLPIVTPESSPSILTIPRQDMYFSGARKELKEPYLSAVNLIANTSCRTIALAFAGDDWEYPLWVLLKSRGNFLITHINVSNVSKQLNYPVNTEQICAVISTSDRYTNSNWSRNIISDNPYFIVYLAGDL